MEVCGVSRTSRGGCRTAWWSKEVQDAVRAKKIAYRRLLSQQSEEAKLTYHEAKNEEWIRLGKEM